MDFHFLFRIFNLLSFIFSDKIVRHGEVARSCLIHGTVLSTWSKEGSEIKNVVCFIVKLLLCRIILKEKKKMFMNSLVFALGLGERLMIFVFSSDLYTHCCLCPGRSCLLSSHHIDLHCTRVVAVSWKVMLSSHHILTKPIHLPYNVQCSLTKGLSPA